MLSRILKTKCIYFEYEDVSDWQGYSLFIDGEVAERYDFGLDYQEETAEALAEMREEMPEFLEDIGEELPEELDDGIPWDINTTDEQGDYQFLFRSTLRSVSEDEVKDEKAFLNHFFVSQDALLPDWSDIPYFSEDEPLELPEANFVRVDFIEID